MNNTYEKLKAENEQYTRTKSKIQAKVIRKIITYSIIITVTTLLILSFIIMQYKLIQMQIINENKDSNYSLMRNELTLLDINLKNITGIKEAIEDEIESQNHTYKITFDKLLMIEIEKNNLKLKLRAIEETPNHFSTIILSYSDKRLLEQMTQLKFGKICFRSSRDTHNSTIFHKNCDEISPTITIVKTTQGIVFGGVTYQRWNGVGYKTDDNAFLFSLNLKKKYPVTPGSSSAIFTKNNAFPCFGIMDVVMAQEYNLVNSFFNSFSNSIVSYEINSQQKDFDIEELEVFHLINKE